ncbi:MAG TPA: DUF1697 domain-containing protein [Gemmatimonadaceae bacterium]|nr:DUF1697 domain-containing protein [Gemmatimonadaceae bacterium]
MRPSIAKHIALLRAINVGGRTVKMDHLRELFAELGFRNVGTLIASGNVAFDATTAEAAKLESKIERHLHTRLGFLSETYVRSRSDLEAVIAHTAFPAATVKSAHALWIAFMKKEPTRAAVETLMTLRCPTEEFHVRGREVYWLRRRTSTESQFKGSLDKILGQPVTARNITTVRKLAEM